MSQDTNLTRDEMSEQDPAAQADGEERITASKAIVDCFQQYAREKPEVVALWAFGIGFVLGWKLKPW